MSTSWSPGARTPSPLCASRAGCRDTRRAPSRPTTGSRTATRPPRSATRTASPWACTIGARMDRRVVAILGDGSLTGGMAYEALNNLGHAGTPVVIVLNDNGRSYAPTVSRLSAGLTHLRLSPSYVHARERARHVLRAIPGLGGLAYSSLHGRHERRARDRHPPPVLRGARGPLRRPDRRPRHRRHGAGARARHGMGRTHRRPRPHPEGPGLRPGRGGRRPAPARLQGAADRGGTLGRHRTGDLHRCLHPRRARGGPAPPEVVAITAAMPGPTGSSPVPGRVPRPVPRRRHRRAARRHRRRRHGHGRTAPGGRHLLHLLQPRLRPGQPRRRAPRPPGGLRPRPRRHHRGRRAQSPRRPRPVAHARRSRG